MIILNWPHWSAPDKCVFVGLFFLLLFLVCSTPLSLHMSLRKSLRLSWGIRISHVAAALYNFTPVFQ